MCLHNDELTRERVRVGARLRLTCFVSQQKGYTAKFFRNGRVAHDGSSDGGVPARTDD